MARLRVRNEILRALGMFMLEKGKILEKHDYDQYGSEVPIRSGMALNHFGSWSRILQTMEGSLPELWKEIQEASAPPPPPPPPPKPEADPLAALAEKTASVKEESEDDE